MHIMTQALNIKTQKVNIPILIENKVILKARSITRDEVEYFMKRLTQRENIIILNLYASNDIRLKDIK